MAVRRVMIVDPNGSKKTLVEVPSDVRTERLLPALVQRMGLPTFNQAGGTNQYRLAYNRQGEETTLNPDESLDSAGVEDDDVLRLYADMQGGSGHPTRISFSLSREPRACAEDTDFEIKIHSSEVVEGPVASTPYRSPVEIIVDDRAWREMHLHARQDLLREVGGIMLGEIHEHDGGHTVRITHSIPALEAVGELSSISFTPEAWRQMELERERSGLDAKLVGWYHTHPGFKAFFSEVDRFMHDSFFPELWHIALVLDPVRGEHRFYRRQGEDLRPSSDFLLEIRDRAEPTAPLSNRLIDSLLSCAENLRIQSENDGSIKSLPTALERLARNLPMRSADGMEVLFSLILACSDMDAECLEEVRRSYRNRLRDDHPLELADLISVVTNVDDSGAIDIKQGYLAQLVGGDRVHVHRVDLGGSLCKTPELPFNARDLTLDEEGRLLMMTNPDPLVLQMVGPPVNQWHKSTPSLQASQVKLDFQGGELKGPVGKIHASRGHLYLLTRAVLWILRRRVSEPESVFELVDLQQAANLNWPDFKELTDWATDLSGNLFLLMAGKAEIWWYRPKDRKWTLLVNETSLRTARSLCAGLGSLSILCGQETLSIIRYSVPGGEQLGRRAIDEDLKRKGIRHLFNDGYQRLYVATDQEILATE